MFVPDGLVITDVELLALGPESVKEVGLLLGPLGFIQGITDVRLYFKAGSGGMTAVKIYVDGSPITDTDDSMASQFLIDMAILDLKGVAVASNV
ncbi:hypothetical protein PInf_010506 [Phytophthora infestans]|nr:hypothetical protein PInf_010506 [Phytophthora infestans]